MNNKIYSYDSRVLTLLTRGTHESIMVARVEIIEHEFRGLTFEALDLLDCQFVRCKFFNCSFVSLSYMEGCKFEECDLYECIFDDTDLLNVEFEKCSLLDMSFTNSAIKSCRFRYLNEFERIQFKSVGFEHLDLYNLINSRNISISDCTVLFGDFVRFDCDNLNLVGTVFTETTIMNCFWTNSSIDNVMHDCDLGKSLFALLNITHSVISDFHNIDQTREFNNFSELEYSDFYLRCIEYILNGRHNAHYLTLLVYIIDRLEDVNEPVTSNSLVRKILAYFNELRKEGVQNRDVFVLTRFMESFTKLPERFQNFTDSLLPAHENPLFDNGFDNYVLITFKYDQTDISLPNAIELLENLNAINDGVFMVHPLTLVSSFRGSQDFTFKQAIEIIPKITELFDKQNVAFDLKGFGDNIMECLKLDIEDRKIRIENQKLLNEKLKAETALVKSQVYENVSRLTSSICELFGWNAQEILESMNQIDETTHAAIKGAVEHHALARIQMILVEGNEQILADLSDDKKTN